MERGGCASSQTRYDEAAADLQAALALREDAYARELLAASLHLLGRTDEALASWNLLGRPEARRASRSPASRTRGTRWRAASCACARASRSTSSACARAAAGSLDVGVFERVTLRPYPRGDGTADLEVALLERHGLASSRAEFAAATLAQLADRRIGLRYANLGGTGARPSACPGASPEGRPELALGLDWPRPFGLDANLRLVARRGRQGYLFEEPVERTSRGLDLAPAPRARRAHGGGGRVLVSRSGILGREPVDACRASVTGVQLGLERRLLEAPRHRLDAEVRAFAAGPALGGELSFVRGVASLRYEWALGSACRARAHAPRGAGPLRPRAATRLPLDEGFVPGGGPESPFPLRAHRQFEDGVAGGTPLGRSLMLFNTECAADAPVARAPSARGASPSTTRRLSSRGLETTPWQHDVGVGLRFAPVGHDRPDRLGAWAHGWRQCLDFGGRTGLLTPSGDRPVWRSDSLDRIKSLYLLILMHCGRRATSLFGRLQKRWVDLAKPLLQFRGKSAPDVASGRPVRHGTTSRGTD